MPGSGALLHASQVPDQTRPGWTRSGEAGGVFCLQKCWLQNWMETQGQQQALEEIPGVQMLEKADPFLRLKAGEKNGFVIKKTTVNTVERVTLMFFHLLDVKTQKQPI